MWLTIALVALVHSELEWPKYFSHNFSFKCVGLIMFRLLSRRSGKFLLLSSDAWNVIFHLFKRSSHLFFWLNSYEDLHRNRGVKLNFLVSLYMILWSDQLSWLGQSQNSRELWWFLSKKYLISLEIKAIWVW